MKRRILQPAHLLAALAAATLGLAGAPAAEAARAHSLHGLSVHLRSAARSLGRLTAQPAGPLAEMYLARLEAQTALAGAVARAIAAAARDRASSERGATALGLVADEQTSEAQSLTSVLGVVRPELQAAVAHAISTATAGRGVVLGKLSGLLPAVSPQARPVVAEVVALESSQGAQVPVQLAGTLGASTVTCAATGAVQQALVVATRAFQVGLSSLGPALALVPAGVRERVQAEIDGIPSLLADVEQQLTSAPTCAPAPAASTGGAAPVAALGTPALLGGVTQLVDGILGSLVPGFGAGRAPAPAPAPLAGLLGGFAGLRSLD